MKYRTIYADPPWPERGAGKIKRGADKHYPLMSVKEISDLGAMVRDVADPEGCHLYLWTTNNFLHDAMHVMEAWGFTYITIITWYKEGRIGLGQYYRGVTEHCLFRRRGMLPYRTHIVDGVEKRAQGTTGFMSKNRKHSQKPDEMRRTIELVSWPPYVELFARPPHPIRWEVWGDEVEEDSRDQQLTLELMCDE